MQMLAADPVRGRGRRDRELPGDDLENDDPMLRHASDCHAMSRLRCRLSPVTYVVNLDTLLSSTHRRLTRIDVSLTPAEVYQDSLIEGVAGNGGFFYLGAARWESELLPPYYTILS